MAPIVALTLSLLAPSRSSSATPLQAQRPCVDFDIPVAVDAINSDWDAPRVSSTAEAVNFVLSSEA